MASASSNQALRRAAVELLLQMLLLQTVTCGLAAHVQSATHVQSAAGGVRSPRWFWDSLFSSFPSTSGITDRVSGAFSRNTFDEAVSVLIPRSGVTPLICQTTDDEKFEEGVCMRVADCVISGGTHYGPCAGGLIGSCCVFEKKCDHNSNSYVTHFTNPRYPSPTTGTGECKLIVNPMHDNVCQFRLDFDEFNIVGPDESSDCVTDFLGVTGGTPVPKLCGDLTGQHVYVNVKPASGPIELSMDTATTLVYTRLWNIRVTQIPCGSPNLAPPGCLQFYNSTSGTIRSLNFKDSLPDEGTTYQLQKQNYGACVNSKVDYCELTWTASEQGLGYSFTLNGDAARNTSDFQTFYGPEDCNEDYVTIPGGIYEDENGNPVEADRYCGTKFPTRVRTSSQPYRLYVTTNVAEDFDNRNAGFALNFRHSLC
ncbi:CUB domain [Trinorchestia longiramus]|nr:CUB domain [Trinorchestia longiramus]